ncbi:MAG: hypothetical protein ABSC34_03440 [Acidimicrobiales bacterium]|jgi:hypothetical protein
MKTRAATDIAYGQIGFVLFLVVCVALHPGFVFKANEGGMSNYGIHIKTAAPYTLALGLPALLSYRAARLIGEPDPMARRFQRFLRAYSLLLALTLLSTYIYSLNEALRDVHVVVGAALIILETGGGVWMYTMPSHRRGDGLILTILLVGFVLAALTIVGVLHILFVTQVVTGGAFAFLLVHATQGLCVSSMTTGSASG